MANSGTRNIFIAISSKLFDACLLVAIFVFWLPFMVAAKIDAATLLSIIAFYIGDPMSYLNGLQVRSIRVYRMSQICLPKIR